MNRPKRDFCLRLCDVVLFISTAQLEHQVVYQVKNKVLAESFFYVKCRHNHSKVSPEGAHRSRRVLLHAIVRQNPPRIKAKGVTIMGNPHLLPSGCFPCNALRRTKQNTSS